MKVIMILILIIGLIIYSANPVITLHPFRIAFKSPYFAVGLLLLMIGLSLIQYQSYLKGKSDGVDMVINTVEKELNNKTNKSE